MVGRSGCFTKAQEASSWLVFLSVDGESRRDMVLEMIVGSRHCNTTLRGFDVARLRCFPHLGGPLKTCSSTLSFMLQNTNSFSGLKPGHLMPRPLHRLHSGRSSSHCVFCYQPNSFAAQPKTGGVPASQQYLNFLGPASITSFASRWARHYGKNKVSIEAVGQRWLLPIVDT